MKKPKFVVTYGKDYKKIFNDEKKARDFAYEKGFYFSVKINNIPYDRPF